MKEGERTRRDEQTREGCSILHIYIFFFLRAVQLLRGLSAREEELELDGFTIACGSEEV